mgnify:FL=1
MTDNTKIKGFYSGKKVLFTGGAGYIAYNVTEILKSVDCKIVRFDIGSKFPVIKDAKAEITDISGDIKDAGTLEKLLKDVDVVFHFAAQTSVYVANDDPAADAKVNILPLINMLEIARKNGNSPAFIFSGTVTVSGVDAPLPVNDSSADDPVSIYDLHKIVAEQYIEYYSKMGHIKGAILRLANIYGPGPKSSSSDRGILKRMVIKALSGQDLTVYGAGDFLRDYIHVKDVAMAFLLAGANADALRGKHFVISSGKGTKLVDAFYMVADQASKRTGKKVKVVSVPPPQGLSPIENRNFIGDPSGFKKLTGWKNDRTLEDGIIETIDFFREGA